MFGTMGISELVIILVIVLIIFGAGRLPQIGEGVGKALRGFKKEVNEPPPPLDPNAQIAAPATSAPQPLQAAPVEEAQVVAPAATQTPTASYTPGPEATPGTTAALMAQAAPQPPKPPKSKVGAQQPTNPSTSQGAATGHTLPTMEERAASPAPAPRAAYPPVPPASRPQPITKRPSAVVNKDAVARVQAQQAAMREKSSPTPGSGLTPDDMHNFGAGIGDALRTIRSAVTDVRNTIEPEVRTLRAEVDAAQKEVEQSVELAKEIPSVQEEPPPKKS